MLLSHGGVWRNTHTHTQTETERLRERKLSKKWQFSTSQWSGPECSLLHNREPIIVWSGVWGEIRCEKLSCLCRAPERHWKTHSRRSTLNSRWRTCVCVCACACACPCVSRLCWQSVLTHSLLTERERGLVWISSLYEPRRYLLSKSLEPTDASAKQLHKITVLHLLWIHILIGKCPSQIAVTFTTRFKEESNIWIQ